MTCQSQQTVWPYILCSHTSLSPFKLWSSPKCWGPHHPGTTNKETMFLCMTVSVSLLSFFSFFKLHCHPCPLLLFFFSFPFGESVVSAKCKGAVKSYPVGRCGRREESLRDKSVGSSWQHSHNAGESLSESLSSLTIRSQWEIQGWRIVLNSYLSNKSLSNSWSMSFIITDTYAVTSALFQANDVSMHRTGRITEWFI